MTIFIAWIVFIPLEQKKKLDSHKNVCKNKDSCDILMPSEDTKILEPKIRNIRNLIKHHLLFMQILNL